MTAYDFRGLSPDDFVRLCSDLIRAELGGRLESFTTGPDSGIDFRLALSNSLIIGQCKHYADSPFRTLLAKVRNQELPRVRRLSPDRYILTTSVGLTPSRKHQLFDLLQPHCRSPADIYGKDDLNHLLRKHPDVEEQHYKLWLTSAATLRRVLHERLLADSASHLDEVRRRLSRYVQNASLHRANEILDEHHVCIISGLPGIGKTTLAEVLIAQLVDKGDFTLYRINSRLEEIRPTKDRSKRQVFYFDDFLGRTELAQLERNEDRHLVDLMRQVGETDGWRLIMTTREYIMNAAKSRYEALHQLPAGFARCIIDLADHTRPVRAKILYNHVYFSSLPKCHKMALLENQAYLKVIDHPNYSPRLVEFMTDHHYVRHQSPEAYVSAFLGSLDDPRGIWEHAFLHQISASAQRLVLTIATLPRGVCEEDARECFQELGDYRRAKYGLVMDAGEWREALRTLDGSFIATLKAGPHVMLKLHNPSVEDFVKEHLRRSPSDLDDLLASAVFFEQYVYIWSVGEGRAAVDSGALFESVRRFVPGRSARWDSTGLGFFATDPVEDQVLFLMRLGKEIGRHMDEVRGAMDELRRIWAGRGGDKRACLRLLQYWKRRVGGVPESTLLAVQKLLLDVDEGGEIEEFGIIASFIETFPDAVSDRTRRRLGDRFERDLWDLDDETSVEYLEEMKDVVILIGRVLEADVDFCSESISERIAELEMEAADAVSSRKRVWPAGEEVGRGQAGIEAMFARLKDDLSTS